MRYLLVLVLSGCPIVVTQITQDYNTLCARLIVAGQLDEADAACDHALEYQPSYWDALHNKGLIAQSRGDKKKARKFYMLSLRANPDMMSSLNAMGALAQEEGNLAEAISYFKSALRINPEYLEARRNLGAVHLQQKDFAEAIRQFRLLLQSEPNLVEGHLGMASALLAQEKFDEAAISLERATTLDVNDDRAWLMRGRCELMRGRRDEAKDAFERCLLSTGSRNIECELELKSLTSD